MPYSTVQEKLPEGSQTHFRSIVTDQHCRVLGSNGSIYAIGDAATIQQVPHLLLSGFKCSSQSSGPTLKLDWRSCAAIRALSILNNATSVLSSYCSWLEQI